MRLAVLLSLLAFVPTHLHAADLDVDVALVLAVDVSGSITADEATMQREGYADAIESDPVMQAIESGVTGRIAISYMEWSDEKHQRVVVPWSIIEGEGDAKAIAASLRSGQPKSGLNTSIATALQFAGDYLALVPWRPERRVIDISGDGASNTGGDVEPVRQALLARGIVINGLPICETDRNTGACRTDVFDYYREKVIGGPGSFVVTAKGVGDFATAVRTKIAMEIANVSPPSPLQFAEARVVDR